MPMNGKEPPSSPWSAKTEPDRRWLGLFPGLHRNCREDGATGSPKDSSQTSRRSARAFGPLAYAILGGTLIPIDRIADQKPHHSGKHRRHGVNVQIIADAAGRLVRASAALPARRSAPAVDARSPRSRPERSWPGFAAAHAAPHHVEADRYAG